MMVFFRREQIRFAMVTSVIQAIRDDSDDGKRSKEAIERLEKVLLPYAAEGSRQAEADVENALKQEFARGPMKIAEVKPEASVRSKLREKMWSAGR